MATIQEMRDQADVIYEARQDGENTQIRVGKLFQDIVDYLGGNSPEGNIVYFDSAGDIEVSNGNLLNVGEISANRLNLFEGGGTHSLDVVDGELCYDGVPISDYGGALVEWENIQNKPSVFPTEGTYGTSLSITGDSVKVLNLKSGDNIISTVTLPTAGSMSGYIPYTINTHGNTSIPYSADINSIALHTINSQGPTSESNLLWVNSLNNSPRLMFNDTNLLSGIHWGPSWNTPMIDEEKWVKLEGSVWANTYKISNYTQREGESEYSYNGGFELQVKDGELWYDNLQVTETVEDIRRLKISGGIEKLYLDNYHRLYLADSEGEPIDGTEVELAPFIPDDLKLTSNHLYLWSNAANNGEGAAIGSGVELPASGGGGTGGSVSWNDITGKPNVVTFDSHGNIEVEGNHLIRIEDVECGSVESNSLIVRGYDSTADQTVTVGEIDGVYGSLDEPELMIQTFDNHCIEIVTPHLYLNGQELFAGGGGSTKLKVGSTTVSPDSNGIITIGYAGGTTVSTGTNSITISSTGGSGGISKLKVGNTDVLPDSNGAITFAGSGVSASGSTITITGGGGEGTVTQVSTGSGLTGGPITGSGTISVKNGGISNTMLADDAVTNDKLNDNVGQDYLNATSINNLINALTNAGIAITTQLNENNHLFWAPVIDNSGYPTAGRYYYYKKDVTVYSNIHVVNAVVYFWNSYLRVCYNSNTGKVWTYNESTGPEEGVLINGTDYAYQILNDIFNWNNHYSYSSTASERLINIDLGSLNVTHILKP